MIPRARDAGRRHDRSERVAPPMTDDPLQPYVLAACDGGRCRALMAVDGEPLDDLLAWMAALAQDLRRRRVVGRLVLIEREPGAAVARRRLWP